MTIKSTFLTRSISRRAGGMFSSVRRLAQEMGKMKGTEVEVLSLRDESTDEDLAAWLPLKPHVFPNRGPTDFGYSPALDRSLRKMDPALVRVDGLWTYPSVACLKWSQATRRPYLVAPRGMLDPWALAHSKWKKRMGGMLFEREHLRSATCIHALGESEAKSIRAWGLKNPICILPNGVDLPAEEVGVRKDAESLEVPSFPVGQRVLLYLGRLHPKKGLTNLLHAWKAVRRDQTGEAWLLAIAGWDQEGHETELRQLVSVHGLENSVRFLGPQFGRAREFCYRNSHAFILPSFSEGLPMAVLEAWSFGKPVLMTPECNLPEGFASQAALWIEPQSESIGEGLRQLFEMSDGDREAMGRRGLDLVKNQFRWPKIALQMRSVHEWMLGSGPKPACVEMA